MNDNNDKNNKSGCLVIYLIGIVVFLILGADFGTALMWPVGMFFGLYALYRVATGQERKK